MAGSAHSLSIAVVEFVWSGGLIPTSIQSRPAPVHNEASGKASKKPAEMARASRSVSWYTGSQYETIPPSAKRSRTR